MSKHAKKTKDTRSVELKVVRSTKDIVRPALLQTVLGLGLEQIYEIVEEERAALCGTSKSAVSRRFVKGTKKRLDELLSRELSGLDLVAVMIDGLVVGDHVTLVAIGVGDADGPKHVLGVQEGAT